MFERARGRGWPRIDADDAALIEEVLDGIIEANRLDDVRLGVAGLLDVSGAEAFPGQRSLWQWLAGWCTSEGSTHPLLVSKMFVFTAQWHREYEQRSDHPWLGLAPGSEDDLSLIWRGGLAACRALPAGTVINAVDGLTCAELLDRIERGGEVPGPAPSGQPARVEASWLEEGERRSEEMVTDFFGTPESIASGGLAAVGRGDIAAGLFFFQKAIDLLHTLYVISQMRSRQPTGRDRNLVSLYVDTLSEVRSSHPEADIRQSVIEVTHRLRTIATACRDAGTSPTVFVDGLESLAEAAPDIDVSKVFWRTPSLDEVLGRDTSV